jgi:hypothetical protein
MMLTCSSGKKVYTTQEMAEDALVEMWQRYNVSSTNGPIAIYKCEDCGCYHFTSRGPMNEKLAKYLAEGKLKRDREAKYWEDKFSK